MTRDDLIERCRVRGACDEAIAWLATLPASATLADVWASCERGDWMLWLAMAAEIDRRLVVEAACDCAETALVHVPPGDERPARAIAAARAWARGETTAGSEAAARAAARASYAYAAADTAAAYAAGSAAAAAYAAAAVYADAYAADANAYVCAVALAVAYAADAAAEAAADATAEAAAEAAAYAQHAALVRGRISAADVEAAMLAA
jgi:hypothetical protein